jgi:transmembrane sensor
VQHLSVQYQIIMNYYQFNAEDFAADDYFKEWVCMPTVESDVFWAEFQREYPEKYYALEEGRILVEALSEININVINDEQINKLWSRIDETVSENKSIGIANWATKSYWRIAASIILLLSIGWIWKGEFLLKQTSISASIQEKGDWKEVINNQEAEMLVKLSDGSLVHLHRNGQIKYKEEFSDGLREVYLKGEAFFEVEKDPEKPFLVYANGLVTKVLGTSFTIQARENEPDITVAVKTGRVSVYSDKAAKDPETQGIILMPNQKAVFQKETAILTKTLVDKPTILVEKANLPSFAFEDASAAEVFATLEKAYGVDVVFDEELMKNCTLTINLNEEDLFQKLEVICKVLEANYKLIDAQVIIYSKGC